LRGVGGKIPPPCGIFSADRPPIEFFGHTSCNRTEAKSSNNNCSLNRKSLQAIKIYFKEENHGRCRLSVLGQGVQKMQFMGYNSGRESERKLLFVFKQLEKLF
jgi:hypothetical protein